MKLFMSLSVVVCCMSIHSYYASAQGGIGRETFGVSTTFAPNSSHILIGDAEKRRIWTSGVNYTRQIWERSFNRIDYEVSIAPLFRESDPTIVALREELQGQKVIYPIAKPSRVVVANGLSLGTTLAPEGFVDVYPVYGRQSTYAVEASPIGLRWSGFQRFRIQPTLGIDIGVVYATRSLPVDNACRFNYEFTLGPGLQVLVAPKSAVRLEYLYRHISNANRGEVNPGIDSGVFRLTLSRFYR